MSETMAAKQEGPAEVGGVERTQSGNAYTPRFDIWETDAELILYGDLPGVTAESLSVEFENDLLTIHGKVEARHADLPLVYGEYGIGDYHRTFAIGESIDPARIAAELRGGVLTLHLPKTRAAKPRRIEVMAR